MPATLGDLGEIVTAYACANSQEVQDSPGSIPSLSAGLSTRDDSWTSSRSLLLATPRTIDFSPSISSGRTEHLDGSIKGLVRNRSSRRNYLTAGHFIQQTSQPTNQSVLREGTDLGLKLQCNAPRLAIVPLPSFEFGVDTTSPPVGTTSMEHRKRPRYALKRSRSIIVCDHEESICSPRTASKEETSSFCNYGGVLSARSPCTGLGITVEDGQPFLVESDSGSKGLRRVHGCVDLKSLWLQVGVPIMSNDGTFLSLCVTLAYSDCRISRRCSHSRSEISHCHR